MSKFMGFFDLWLLSNSVVMGFCSPLIYFHCWLNWSRYWFLFSIFSYQKVYQECWVFKIWSCSCDFLIVMDFLEHRPFAIVVAVVICAAEEVLPLEAPQYKKSILPCPHVYKVRTSTPFFSMHAIYEPKAFNQCNPFVILFMAFQQLIW